jgi:hypothetical protein
MFQMDNLHVTLCGLIDKYHNQELKFEESRFEIFCPVSVVWNNCSLFLPRFKNIYFSSFFKRLHTDFLFTLKVHYCSCSQPLLIEYHLMGWNIFVYHQNKKRCFCVPPKRLNQQFYGFWVFVLPDFCLKTFRVQPNTSSRTTSWEPLHYWISL